MRPVEFIAAQSYQRKSLGLLAGAAAGGAVAALVPENWAPVPPLALALCGTALALRRPRLAAPAGLAGAALAGLPSLWSTHAAFALFVAGAGAGSIIAALAGSARMERIAAALAVALAYLLGARAVAALAGTGLFAILLPAPLAAAALGLSVGVFLALGAAAGHVASDPDPVEAAHATLAPRLDAELAGLTSRALAAHRAIRRALRGGDLSRQRLFERLSGSTSRALALAARCQDVDDEARLRGGADPAGRLAELASLEAQAQDEDARQAYARARASVEEEQVALLRVRADRDRIRARLHAQLAVLERTRAALIGLRSAGAVQDAASLERAMEPIAEVATSLDAEAAALAEASRIRS